jgi:hypothetical protein
MPSSEVPDMIPMTSSGAVFREESILQRKSSFKWNSLE